MLLLPLFLEESQRVARNINEGERWGGSKQKRGYSLGDTRKEREEPHARHACSGSGKRHEASQLSTLKLRAQLYSGCPQAPLQRCALPWS